MTVHEPNWLIDSDDIAEPWRRLVGFVIDWFVLVSLSLVIVSALGIDMGEVSALRLPTTVRILQGLVGAAYYIVFTVSRGQTPGKMLIGTRVVMQQTGQIPDLAPSVVRWFVPGVWVFLPGVSIISVVIYGWLVFDTLHKGLHDKAARTVVVHAR
jgi:uncharacterized RDD family membrane protein YckC